MCKRLPLIVLLVASAATFSACGDDASGPGDVSSTDTDDANSGDVTNDATPDADGDPVDGIDVDADAGGQDVDADAAVDVDGADSEDSDVADDSDGGDSMDDTPDIDGELAALIAATTFQCEAYTVERCRLMLHPACDGIENRDTDLGTVSAVLGHDGNFGTEEECVAAYTAPLCLAMLSGVELGFRGFDETAGAMCLSWLQEVSCETYYSENAELLELNGCNDVQVPLQDTGDPCIATQDCSPPDVCPGERSPFVYHAFPDTEYVYGECQPPQVEGEACTSDIHCAEGLVCSTATRRCAPEPTEE